MPLKFPNCSVAQAAKMLSRGVVAEGSDCTCLTASCPAQRTSIHLFSTCSSLHRPALFELCITSREHKENSEGKGDGRAKGSIQSSIEERQRASWSAGPGHSTPRELGAGRVCLAPPSQRTSCTILTSIFTFSLTLPSTLINTKSSFHTVHYFPHEVLSCILRFACADRKTARLLQLLLSTIRTS
jgi:hypothetical protein